MKKVKENKFWVFVCVLGHKIYIRSESLRKGVDSPTDAIPDFLSVYVSADRHYNNVERSIKLGRRQSDCDVWGSQPMCSKEGLHEVSMIKDCIWCSCQTLALRCGHNETAKKWKETGTSIHFILLIKNSQLKIILLTLYSFQTQLSDENIVLLFRTRLLTLEHMSGWMMLQAWIGTIFPFTKCLWMARDIWLQI